MSKHKFVDGRVFKEYFEPIPFECEGIIHNKYLLIDGSFAAVSVQPTINSDIFKVCLYVDGELYFCNRYNKRNFTGFNSQEMLIRYCTDKYIGV